MLHVVWSVFHWSMFALGLSVCSGVALIWLVDVISRPLCDPLDVAKKYRFPRGGKMKSNTTKPAPKPAPAPKPKPKPQAPPPTGGGCGGGR
jgi:hypothetical protein